MVSCVYIAIDKNGLKENKGNALNMKKFLKCVFKRVVFLHMLRLQYGLHAKESAAINHHYSLFAISHDILTSAILLKLKFTSHWYCWEARHFYLSNETAPSKPYTICLSKLCTSHVDMLLLWHFLFGTL